MKKNKYQGDLINTYLAAKEPLILFENATFQRPNSVPVGALVAAYELAA